jgi:uncharacterized membrane protein
MRRHALVATLALALTPAPALAQAPVGLQMRDVVAALSPAGRALFVGRWLTPMRQANAAHRITVQRAQDAVFAAMAADPFDAGALRRAYAGERRVATDYQVARQARLVDILARLSPADRHLVVTRLLAIRDAKAAH